MRYGETILPLTALDDLLVDRRHERRYAGEDLPEDLQVLVHRRGGTLHGVVVGRIMDVIDEPLELQPPSRPGVRGTMVLDGRVTEVLDLAAIFVEEPASEPRATMGAAS